MPTYGEVAVALVRIPSEESARLPLDSRNVDGGFGAVGATYRGIVFSDSDGNGISVSTEFWTVVPAFVVIPNDFFDSGEPIAAGAALASIGEGGGTFKFEIPGALSTGKPLVLTVTMDGGVYYGDIATPAWVWDVKSISDNHDSDSGLDLFGQPISNLGKPVTASISMDGSFVPFLPNRSGTFEFPFWVIVGDSTSDFQNLIIDAQGSVESQAERSLALECAYDARLEDLDTRIRWGEDSAGIAIVWRVSGTERRGRSMLLNLAANIV